MSSGLARIEFEGQKAHLRLIGSLRASWRISYDAVANRGKNDGSTRESENSY
jgi:hypothetical protein